jgi:hypothetical protein
MSAFEKWKWKLEVMSFFNTVIWWSSVMSLPPSHYVSLFTWWLFNISSLAHIAALKVMAPHIKQYSYKPLRVYTFYVIGPIQVPCHLSNRCLSTDPRNESSLSFFCFDVYLNSAHFSFWIVPSCIEVSYSRRQ